MKSATKNIVLAVALIFFVGVLGAQENGLGPHGGRLKTVGNYKIEVFGCNDYLEVYLFDSASDPINNNSLSGTVEFFYTAKATLSSPLVHYGMDGFTAKIPANTFLYCKPSFNMNGMFVVTEKFENECLMSAGKN